MTASDLKAISISDFRSIRGTIALPLDAPVVLLYGANGAGKTSVMSAIELALTGTIVDVVGEDRRHLVHRGAGAAVVDLTTSSAAVSFRVEGSAIEGSPLLMPDDARFFTERCYLAQRTLGQLLELYQSADGQGDSPLTKFVKELLRLDELEALFDGLEPVRDKRLVKRLVPEYAEAERELESRRKQIADADKELMNLGKEADVVRADLTDALTNLDAPLAVQGELEPGGSAARWLDAMDDEVAIVGLVATRQELAGLRARWAPLSATPAAKDSAAAEADERSCRDAADAWWRDHGAALETLLTELRADFPGMPAAIGSADPAAVHKLALDQVTTERMRLSAAVLADDRALQEIQQLDTAIAHAQARVASIDEQLASSDTASAAEELSRALAALIPHVHGENCPVCNRSYDEISDQPLTAHLATRVSELGERAERLQSFAKARLEAVGDLRSSQDARDALGGGRMEPAEKVAAKATIARLAEAHGRLTSLASGVTQGAQVIRRKVEAERARTLVREKDRESVELRLAAAALASAVGLPPVDDVTSLDEALKRLGDQIGAQISTIEQRDALCRRARKLLLELAERTRVRTEREASVERWRTALAHTETAVKELDRRRELMRALRDEAEENRIRIVRRVFNRSLNRIWRDLFVRLAPDEPFVPAFRVPQSAGERVAANLETVHRDGKPGGSPGTMLSAGNLNTAALTLFLALHLSAGPRLPWLLLDDPVQSMDEVHVSQFAALLRTLSKAHGKRVVIAVHEQPLFDYLALELSPAQPGETLVTAELSRSRDGASIAEPMFHTFKEDRALAAV